MFLVTSPTVINVPTRGLLFVETMQAIVQWLANVNIKRNLTSIFVTRNIAITHKTCVVVVVVLFLKLINNSTVKTVKENGDVRISDLNNHRFFSIIFFPIH